VSDVRAVYVLEVASEHRTGRGRWWKPDGCGYTSILSWAGLYTADDADDAAGMGGGSVARRFAGDVLNEVLNDSVWMETHGVGFERPFMRGGRHAEGTVGAAMELDLYRLLRSHAHMAFGMEIDGE